MDEGVSPVDPVQESWMLQKPLLERHLPEDVEALLQVDDLEGVFSSNIDCAFDECQSRERSSKLIHLSTESDRHEQDHQAASKHTQ